MNIYLEAFGIFFKIGAFTIGGGYAMVPLIENEIVTKRKWIAQEDFIDLLAISQSAPGILAVNISIFIGYKLRGIRGSIITALGTILPSFIIILAIALFFHSFKDNPIVERIFKGIRPAVVALIAAPTFTNRSWSHLADCDNIRELLRTHPSIAGYHFALNHGKHGITATEAKEPDLEKCIE